MLHCRYPVDQVPYIQVIDRVPRIQALSQDKKQDAHLHAVTYPVVSDIFSLSR
jgi:hypothetical protein